ncbi:MAG TPA: glutamyl-tRNA reductase [Segeticoccus sp.]|uniref:glutamyl-tRNA reductase n=1 Tax=Segeticoccus sp. TaxID=2706531 RepID=UPI002D807A85|nr:glutamyl-tRNA reductase [Segeticoccus sp.]HET8599182.1 glutamyl-tRNA reductase [Segeticoccus sp.]
MSVLVLGLSHRSAPMALLERVALAPDRAEGLAETVHAGESVGEAVVVATCNRVEVYADAATFHGAVSEIGDALSRATGLPMGDLRDHLYVHYEDRAVAHLFSVACGLDSMAVGEGQVLGQLRHALRGAQRRGRAASVLNTLFQQALRVGKRAHAETDLDKVSLSLLEAGLAAATDVVGPVQDRHVLVVGAGSMSSLAAATVAREGAGSLTVINRTAAKARRLAETVTGRARDWSELADALADADVVLSCTGAAGHIVTAEMATAARARRGGAPQVYVDLALPRDVAPAVGELPDTRVVGLEELGRSLERAGSEVRLKPVQDLVTSEVAAYLTGRRAKAVAPTVAALRSRAADVVSAELGRLDQRLPGLSEQERAEVQLTVHRVVEKLLHAPTVRIKELAGNGSGGDYEQALRELFDLDPHDVAAVSVPPEKGPVT